MKAADVVSDEVYASFAASGLSWRVERAHADVVRREVAERLDALESVPGARVIKRNLVRTVLHVPLSTGESVIVKRYAVSGPRDLVKYAFVPSRARAEWTAGRALDASGIPTAVPLAMAERRVGGALRDAALVTREIAGAVHLNAFVETHLLGAGQGGPSGKAALRGALYDDLARTVRRMHDAGFVHGDFHGGNILVTGTTQTPRLFVIDLHSVTRSARPSERARWFDLVKLLHSMLTCSTPAERERICRLYEESGPTKGRISRLAAAGTLSAELEARLVAMERERVRSRTERSLTRSSKFDVARADGFLVHHLRVLPAEALLPLVDAHRATLERGGADVLKNGRRSALTRQTLQLPEGPRSVIVKEYRCSGAGERVKNVLRRPRAVRAWTAGNGLLVRRIAAAEPLALLLAGGGVAPADGFLVMEDLGEASRADLVALARFAGDLDASRRREKTALVLAVARLFRELHGAGVYHGDLKAVNLFVHETPAGPDVVLADYDRVEFDRRVSRRRRVKNLAQLSASVAVCISLADRLRFFREYAAGDPALLAEWKTWFRRVVHECRRKIVVRMEPIE